MEACCNQIIKKSTGRQVGKDHYLAANDVQEDRIRHELGKSVKEEQAAADVYRDRGKYASGAGDKESAQLYDHIAREEDTHKQEFQERGQKLSKQYSTTEHIPQTKREYWVKITKRGASSFSEGSLIRWEEFKADDRKVRERGEEPASVEIVKEPHPGNGNGDKELPATVQGEPIPEKYRTLIPLIDEPLPPGSDYLVPAIVPEEGERKIDAVLRQLKEGVEGIQNSEQFRTFLTTMAKFHEYSLGNQILIAMQKPEATRVAGFQTWKNLGRFVKKGESGIAILAPIMPRKQKNEDEEDEESPLSPVYFKVVHVFDVSQTEGQPLPEFEVPSLTGEANEELFTKALALAKAQGLEVSFDPMPSQDPGVKGFYSGKKIWVKPDEPKAQQLKTLLHEMAHYYSEGVFRIPRRDAETIAESAAFAVGAHFGFDSGTRSFPYVAIWSQDPKVLKANLGSVRKVTSVMLEGLEGTEVGNYEALIPAFDETFGLRKREFDNRNKPRSEWIRREENKLVPALKPFEPYHFAEFVLRYNRFSDAEIPIYSGLTGKAPLRVPDHIWREVIEETEGEFVKQGEISIFHIPEKERPSYMRAAPTWRDVVSTIPTKPCYPNCREEQEFISDSPELIPFTIDDIGYRDKLDDAFEMAIAKVQGG
ncbi:MAG: ArdC family protein [Dehalococcoidales bacterium]|nr:ArdC family protein [Dehalococcoidales bacterium]